MLRQSSFQNSKILKRLSITSLTGLLVFVYIFISSPLYAEEAIESDPPELELVEVIDEKAEEKIEPEAGENLEVIEENLESIVENPELPNKENLTDENPIQNDKKNEEAILDDSKKGDPSEPDAHVDEKKSKKKVKDVDVSGEPQKEEKKNQGVSVKEDKKEPADDSHEQVVENDANESEIEPLFEWYLCSSNDPGYKEGRDLSSDEILLLGEGELEEVVFFEEENTHADEGLDSPKDKKKKEDKKAEKDNESKKEDKGKAQKKNEDIFDSLVESIEKKSGETELLTFPNDINEIFPIEDIDKLIEDAVEEKIEEVFDSLEPLNEPLEENLREVIIEDDTGQEVFLSSDYRYCKSKAVRKDDTLETQGNSGGDASSKNDQTEKKNKEKKEKFQFPEGIKNSQNFMEFQNRKGLFYDMFEGTDKDDYYEFMNELHEFPDNFDDELEEKRNNDEKVFRIHEYKISGHRFWWGEHELQLKHPLEKNHLIFVRGAAGFNIIRGADSNYVRVSALPEGINGELDISSGPDTITLKRPGFAGRWSGVITVIESLSSHNRDGFKLVDVLEFETSNNTVASTKNSKPWNDIQQVVVFGGAFGPGSNVEVFDIFSKKHSSAWARWYPSGSSTVNAERFDLSQNSSNNNSWNVNWSFDEKLETAIHTVYVVEWGSSWNVQHRELLKQNGGNGAGSESDYNVVDIDEVERENTWLWGTGYSESGGIGNGAEGVLYTLGNGVHLHNFESQLALGGEYPNKALFDLYAMSHPNLRVDYIKKPDGNAWDMRINLDTDYAPKGSRFAWGTTSSNGTGYAYPRSIWSFGYKGNDKIRMRREYRGQDFTAWVQGLNFENIIRPQASSLNVDIVDSSGNSVSYPLVEMSPASYSFAVQTVSGTLGTQAEKIQLTNLTPHSLWSVSIAPSLGASALWKDSSYNQSFDFNASPELGRLSIDPSSGIMSRADGGNTSGVALGVPSFFNEGITESITLFSSSSASPFHVYYLENVALEQSIPELQEKGDYKLELTLTVL